MANNEAGAFLNITPDVLKKLDSFDEKLENIEKHSHTAADALKSGFGKVVIDTTKLENAITSLASKIGSLNAAGRVFENIGDSAKQSSVRVEDMSSSISSMAQTLNQLKFSNFSIETFSPENVAKMREAVSQIKSQLKNNTSLSDSDKSALSKEKAMYEQKLREYQSFINIKNKIAANANAEELRQQQATYRKMTNVMESYMKKVEEQKLRYENAMKSMADYAAKSPAQRTSAINNTLSFSANAKTLHDDVSAIKLLKEARLQLDKTDKNYQSTLNQINQAIAKHNQVLQQAGVQSQNLATRHRNLMDTAGQLQRKLALVFSVSQIEGYVSKLAKVRGEFELQQRSLQAILQNKAQADQIFNKTVQLAVKSPFQIKELVTYTKQLAAYRIEGAKLYDTTKMLADVSAGLGVDMQRLILAYGQVKAAAYLRGTEVRQFTEAGINIYGELQKLFKARDQADYTTAQIVDMISKRKVTFEDIETIFKNLTDKGGLFYNMQEIQAETLQGKIANLKDSIDVMLNAIGKANEDTLKGSIDTVKVLIDNWETVVDVAKAFAPIISSMALTAWSKKITGVSNAFGFLSIGLAKSGNAVKAFGATFKASLPLMAITTTIGIVSEFIGTIKEYNKAIAESTNKYFEANIRLSTIKEESKSDIKKSLDKLIQEMNNEGFEIKIKTGISEKEAKDEFKKYLDEYEIFLNEQKLMEARYARNKARWLVDDIDKDIQDYASSYGKFILQGEELKTVMMQLAMSENNLSAEHKKTLEELSKGPKEGEDILSYTKRMKDEIANIWPALNKAFNSMRISNGAYTQEAMNARSSLTKLFNLSKKYISDEKEMISELEDKFGEFDKDMDEAAKKRLKIRIDRSELDAVTKELAYKHYNLNVEIDEEDAKKQIDYVKKSLEGYYDEHPIKIGLSMQTLDENPFEKWMETFSENTKSLRQLEDIQSRLSRILELPEAERGEIALQSLSDNIQKMYKERGGKTYDTFINGELVQFVKDYDIIKEIVDEQVKLLAKTDIAYGGTGKGTKGSNAERDIWSERISVLKEMQSRYEKLNQLMGENAAIEQTLSAFKPALEFTQMGEVIKPEDIIPTKQGMIDALEKLLEKIPNYVKNAAKKTGLEKEIAELKIGIQQDYLKEQLEKTKKNIEDMFNGLDLHKKLKDAGLSEAEVQQLFPGLAKTLDDVEKGIRNEYESKRDENGQLSKTDQKDYDDALNKLNQQRVKESQDLVVELTKNYKTQLSDQMQLDTWYIKERSKIYSKAYDEQTKTFKDVLTPEMQKQYEANLNKEYQKRTSENTWKNFQATDYYIDMFENLDRASTASIKGMLERLQDLRSSLKDLPADQVRAIINQMEKLQETVVSRNPFKTFGESIKAYNEALLELKKVDEYGNLTNESTTYEELEKSQSENAKKLADIEAQKNAENSKLEVLKQQKAEGELYHTLSKKELDDLEKKIADQQKLTDELILQAEIQGKITKAEADQLRNVRNLKKLSEMSAEEIVNGIGNTLSQIGSELPNIASNLENVFGTMSDGLKDTIDTLSEVTSGLGSAANGIGQIMTANGNPFQIISGGLQAIGGITKAIGALFAIGDKKKEKEIQRQIKNVETLGKKYDELKEKMEAAWSADDLRTQTKDTAANLDQQIASYQAMIKAEEDKKKTDKDRIVEWQDAIEDLEKTKQEILNEEKKYMGGLGGETEYKSAAEGFVQAWMDAFNETGDGLKGLEENFDEMINNIFLKQASMRIANKFLDPLFQMIDLAVTEGEEAIRAGFDGETKMTGEEMEKIVEKAKEQFPQLSEALEQLYNALGLKNNKTAELSALTQSIQGITEREAEALESLLNSIRFFVSQQTTDITAIRTLLEARYGLESQNSEANPMLIELRAQTGYLEIISDRIDRVFATNANSRGAGLRVYMQ